MAGNRLTHYEAGVAGLQGTLAAWSSGRRWCSGPESEFRTPVNREGLAGVLRCTSEAHFLLWETSALKAVDWLDKAHHVRKGNLLHKTPTELSVTLVGVWPDRWGHHLARVTEEVSHPGSPLPAGLFIETFAAAGSAQSPLPPANKMQQNFSLLRVPSVLQT